MARIASSLSGQVCGRRALRGLTDRNDSLARGRRPTSRLLKGKFRLHRVIATLLLLLGCGESSVPSPFGGDEPDAAASDASPDVEDAGTVPVSDGASGFDPAIGGPCVDDGQCDDGFACTFDACDTTLGRCRFVPDHATCEDGVFCNGVEVCELGVGCRPGEPVACSDDDVCTIDRCDEPTHTCEHTGRDADGDGDADANCGGTDCDERNPNVSAFAVEVCDNDRDDDCDGDLDETEGCAQPEFDGCADALEVTGDAAFELSPVAALLDASASCVQGGPRWRDLVAAVIVPEGPPVDVDLTLTTSGGSVALAAYERCGDASSELECAAGTQTPAGTSFSRLRLRAPEPGAYAVHAFTDSTQVLTLTARFLPSEPEPANETCGTAALLEPGVHVQGTLVDAATDLDTACNTSSGDLVYRFALAEAQDVRLRFSSLDSYAVPSVSLRTEACTSLDAELTCRSALAGELFWRALTAGTYYVSVAGTGATDFDLVLTTSEPSAAPADESCATAPQLELNETRAVTLADHVDDIQLGCATGAPDAAYAIELTEATDLLLVERISPGDEGAVSLAGPLCSLPLVCGAGNETPVRASLHALQPGSYRVVAESALGNPVSITALARPAAAPILVAFADRCADAIDVPARGGSFQGNTANSSAEYDAGCDVGGQPAGGAPEQMLKLRLDREQRVVLDTRLSRYATLLDVRRGPDCPGTEVMGGCSAGFSRDRSYLDLTLPAGEYFVQVDGYGGAAGAWLLDVYIVEP